MINKKEFEKRIKWDEYGIGYIPIYLQFFNQDILFEIFSNYDKKPSISDKMYSTIKDIINLPVGVIGTIKNLLWEECNFSFSVTDYGCEPKDGETVIEAHFREFGLTNSQDAFEKSNIQAVQIHHKSDKLNARYVEIKIDTATDNLISIIVKNGEIIDYDDNGTCLDWFEIDNQKAHHNRMKILKS